MGKRELGALNSLIVTDHVRREVVGKRCGLSTNVLVVLFHHLRIVYNTVLKYG